ncbi:MAG: hypothetical protein ACREMX_14090 [Gemmatimonadales bacterium]
MVRRWWADRRGRSAFGCLLTLLLFVGALYYGVHIGEVYIRYYRLLDVMRFQASLAPSIPDAVIQNRLTATADSLLGRSPRFRIRRSGRTNKITIETEYSERVQLPLFDHTFVLRPRAEARL